MPVYEIYGVEAEAGVTTSVPVEAATADAAVIEAQRQGINEPRVVGLYQDHLTQAELGTEMSTEELVDKSGPVVRPRMLVGWILLLVALPGLISLAAWIGDSYAWTTAAMAITYSIITIGLLIAAVVAFKRYWS